MDKEIEKLIREIGGRVKRIRENKRIDAKDFADKIDVRDTSLSKIERLGSNSVERLYIIANELGIKITELFEDKTTSVKEIKTDYGFATKEDLAEVVRVLTKEIAKLREEMPQKKSSSKPKKKYNKK